VFRELDYNNPAFPTRLDCVKLLERGLVFFEKCWVDVDEDMGLFGIGVPNPEVPRGPTQEAGRIRPHLETLVAIAALAYAPEYDENITGIPRKQLFEWIEKGLRYLIRTHQSNPEAKNYPQHIWGYDLWQGQLYLTHALFIYHFLKEHLGQDVLDGVRELAIKYADMQLDAEPPGNLLEDTKAEENAWDAPLLIWCAHLFGEHPNAKAWLEKGLEFGVNAYTTYSDKFSLKWVDGKLLKDWIKAVNLFPDGTLENHGSFHPSYLSCYNILLLAAAPFLFSGNPIPYQLTHGVKRAYEIIKLLTAPGGRTIYPCGNDWGRPTIQAGSIFATILGEPNARYYLKKSFRMKDFLQRAAGDGTMWGALKRSADPSVYGSHYFIESSAYSGIGWAYFLLDYLPEDIEEKPISPSQFEGVYEFPYISTIVGRRERIFASFTWRSLYHTPLGVVLPMEREDFAPWEFSSMTGELAIEGHDNLRQKVVCADWVIDREEHSFATFGVVSYKDDFLKLARQYIFFALLGDGSTCLYYELLEAEETVRVLKNNGLNYCIQNDIFNNSKRVLVSELGNYEAIACDGRAEEFPLGKYVRIDDALTISSPAQLHYIKSPARVRMVNFDKVVVKGKTGQFHKGEILREIGAVLSVEKGSAGSISVDHPQEQIVLVKYENEKGERFTHFLLNLSPHSQSVKVAGGTLSLEGYGLHRLI